MYKSVVKMLADRGVTLGRSPRSSMRSRSGYYDSLPLEECLESVEAVVKKREVQNAILTGLALDMLAEEGKLPEPLQSIVAGDDFLFGVDEIVALSITNIYGSIGLTNFGYLDKTKPLVIGRLNSHKNGGCHTFLDDLVSAIAAAAASRIAHARRPSNNED